MPSRLCRLEKCAWFCSIMLLVMFQVEAFAFVCKQNDVAAFKRRRSIFFQSRSAKGAESRDSGEIPEGNIKMRPDKDDGNDDECQMTNKDKPRDRQPPFPASAYPLSQDEERLTHNYISFIDQTILQKYSQQTRLVEPRRYALPDQFLKKNANVPPTVDDVAMPATNYGPIAIFFAWNGLPARAVVGSASYLSFPFIVGALQDVVMPGDPMELSKLVDSFLPGVAIVLGTYFSLTISIIYERLSKLQKAADAEAALLSLTLVNLVHLFEEKEPEAAVEGAQCIADQVRTMVFDSRGRETVGIIYSDPYARILRLLKDYQDDGCQDGYLLSDLHSAVSRLYQHRSDRLTAETLALSPTHFDVMTFLSGLLLAGFVLGAVATAPETGIPSETARVLFSALVVCYTIFYEMAFDLNRPFDGVYQVYRSGAAMHFLQIKHTVTTHPVLAGRVDFDEVLPQEEETGVEDCDADCQQRKSQIWYN